jgi:hypothetical protein
MKRFVILIMLGLVLILSACNGFAFGANFVRGSGVIATDNRTVSGFSGIVLNGSGDATITQGDTESLKIEADDNILPLITSEVIGGKLVLGFKNNTSISTVLPIRFTITVKDLTSLELNGSGNATVGNLTTTSHAVTLRGSGDVNLGLLQASRLTVDGNGSGNIKVNGGKVDSQAIRIFGSGSVNSPNLESQTASVSILGSGGVEVWAKTSLDVNIAGSGNVSYFGSPTVTQKIAGSGNVNSRGAR